MCVADPDPKDFEGCEIITRIRFVTINCFPNVNEIYKSLVNKDLLLFKLFVDVSKLHVKVS